jgi:hypothetical protein
MIMDPTTDAARYADLMRQGFMKPLRKRREPKAALPIVSCNACQNWHPQGKHTASKAERDAQWPVPQSKANKVITDLMVRYLKAGLHYASIRSTVLVVPNGPMSYWIEESKTGKRITLIVSGSYAEKLIDRCAAKALEIVIGG